MYRRRRRRTLGGGRIARLLGQSRGRRGVGRARTSIVGRNRVRARKGRTEVGRSGNRVSVSRGAWMVTREHNLNWGRRFDGVTIRIRVVVRTVSRRVHTYSTEYIAGDAHRQRFRAYLSLFTFGMRRLVTADNRVQLYLGWEGVGVCSYRLINYWYTRRQANKAARKAIVVNRRGDRARGRGISRYVERYGGLGYGELLGRGPREEGAERMRRIESRRIFGGAMGKSAQRGLQVWLPDAMEGPTPVSALIHAATMVTAGVYRRVRRSPIREYTPAAGNVIMVLGGRTARYAGTVGVVQNDRKRVIAYSTCSQLGYIISGCGRAGYEVAIGHLANHARYKGRLFRGAGAVIHGRGDEQDRRGIGGRRRMRPRTYGRMRIGSLALIGMPFRTGFYSKDVRRERAQGSYTRQGQAVYMRRTRAAICTAYYSMRRRHRTFQGEVGGNRKRYEAVEEAPIKIAVPIIVLGRGAVSGGWRTKDRRIGRGTGYWGQSIYVQADGRRMEEAENRGRVEKRMPMRLALVGGISARRGYEVFGKQRYARKRGFKGRYAFRNKKWYRDKRYVERVAGRVREKGHEMTYKGIDRGRYERIGGSGRGECRYRRGKEGKQMHNGERKVYTGWRVKGRSRGVRRRIV
jgi:NADH-ubiquinone oxidoreductase chain 5